MAQKNVSFYSIYTAVDVSTGLPKTGDVANHTLRWVKDGTPSVPTNTPTEVDATNAPGQYKVLITADESNATIGSISGVSSTPNVVVIPTHYAFIDVASITQSTDLITSGNVLVLSPISKGHIEVIKGDSYQLADGRSLDFTEPSGSNWPSDLTGWVITLTANKTSSNTATGDSSLTVTGSVVTPTGSSQKVRIELTKANTDGMASWPHGYDFDIVATSGSDRATLVSGTITVLSNQTVIA